MWPEGVSEDLQDVAAMWATSLKARGRSPATIGGYLWAVGVLIGYLSGQGMPQESRHIKRGRRTPTVYSDC